jgi:protein-L-isoaspartate(D-aspartate) O-methyltransferase
MLTAAGLATPSTAQPDAAMARQRMVEEIGAMIAATAGSSGVSQLDPRVRAAIAGVPRHEFVPLEYQPAAYGNGPLPIGYGQTISQPFIVALMTELLQLQTTDKVLEVSTGSGYQAAILSVLAGEVYTIEIIPALSGTARVNLERLGYKNVRTRIGDGYHGWPEQAPFDAINVTAAPGDVPPALIAQLKPGKRMVIPVGTSSQELLVLVKRADSTISTTAVASVGFVPLVQQ